MPWAEFWTLIGQALVVITVITMVLTVLSSIYIAVTTVKRDRDQR